MSGSTVSVQVMVCGITQEQFVPSRTAKLLVTVIRVLEVRAAEGWRGLLTMRLPANSNRIIIVNRTSSNNRAAAIDRDY